MLDGWSGVKHKVSYKSTKTCISMQVDNNSVRYIFSTYLTPVVSFLWKNAFVGINLPSSESGKNMCSFVVFLKLFLNSNKKQKNCKIRKLINVRWENI